MGRKLIIVAAGVCAGLAVGAAVAFADDTEGGHCDYGDFSVNVMPSCDTSDNDTPRNLQLIPALHQAGDTQPSSH